MEQKLKIVGVRNFAGESKSTGKNYSFYKCTILEPMRLGHVIIAGSGFDARELDLSETAYKSLISKPFPQDVNARLEMDRDNKLKIEEVFFLSPPKP